MVGETGKKIILYDSGRHAHCPISIPQFALLARFHVLSSKCVSFLLE